MGSNKSICKCEISFHLSPIELWNELFPEDPVGLSSAPSQGRNENNESIDLIPARNSSRATSPPPYEVVEDPSLWTFSDFEGGLQGSPPPQGDNSSRTGEGEQGGISSRTAEGKKSSPDASQGGISSRIGPEEFEAWAKEWGVSPRQVENAYYRVVGRDRCGSHGSLLVGFRESALSGVGVEDIAGVIYQPHSCGSVLCPYCQWRHSRKRLSEVLTYLKEALRKGEPLTFITLTVKSTHDSFEAVREAKRLITKLYQFRINGKRNRERLHEAVMRELGEFLANLLGVKGEEREQVVKAVESFVIELFNGWVECSKEGISVRELAELERESVLEELSSLFSRQFFIELDRSVLWKFYRQVYFYADWIGRIWSQPHDVKFSQLLRAVWKFEMTYSPEHGFHPHWHGITDLQIPKVLLTALCRLIGFGEVSDVRAVKGEKALVELSKYELKPWEIDEEALGLKELVKLETAMHSFKKLRVWGFEKVERKEEGGQERVVWCKVPYAVVKARLKGRKNVAELPKRLGELRKRSRKLREVLVDVFSFVAVQGDAIEAEGELHLHIDGDLYLSLSRFKVLGREVDEAEFFRRLLSDWDYFLQMNVGLALEGLVERAFERKFLPCSPVAGDNELEEISDGVLEDF